MILVNGSLDNLKGRATIYAKLEDCAQFSEIYPDSFKNGGLLFKYITTDISEFPKKKRDKFRAVLAMYDLLKELKLSPSRFPYKSTGYSIIPIEQELTILGGSEDIIYAGKHKDFTSCINEISSGELDYLNCLHNHPAKLLKK